MSALSGKTGCQDISDIDRWDNKDRNLGILSHLATSFVSSFGVERTTGRIVMDAVAAALGDFEAYVCANSYGEAGSRTEVKNLRGLMDASCCECSLLLTKTW